MHSHVASYIVVIIFEWITVAFIWFGIRRGGFSMADLIGGSWPRPRTILRDAGIAVLFLIVSGIILNGLGYLLKVVPNQAIRNLIPQTKLEIAIFLMTALTAGFCEEVIFRGYLQRQFAAASGAAAGGIVLQGIAFGIAHLYQGLKLVVVIAVFGSMFGLLAHWRRSLRPGIIAHFLQDGVGGLLARHFLR